jgi:hypothetical protein
VRIGPDGVYVDHHSEAYFINATGPNAGAVPDTAGDGPPDFQQVRRAPAFYAYHDHRVHWMGGSKLPASVDPSDSHAQKVFDATVRFRYDGTLGSVHARQEYIGGRSRIQRYGEMSLMGVGIVVMVAVFLIDARRRRRRAADASSAPR